jgi:hypothetical protein
VGKPAAKKCSGCDAKIAAGDAYVRHTAETMNAPKGHAFKMTFDLCAACAIQVTIPQSNAKESR